MRSLPAGILLVASSATLAAFAPAAAATSPMDPFTATLALDADPVALAPVTLRARVEDHATNMAHGDVLRLELPDWVAVEGSREWRPAWREGGVYETSWTVTPTRVGFWAARLAFADPGESGMRVLAPTLRAWSDAGGGAWSTEAIAQVAPDGAVETRSETAIENGTFVLVVEAWGTRAWMRHAEIFVHGNAMGVGASGLASNGSVARMRLAFELPVGTGAALAPNAGVRVRFDGGAFEELEEQSLACLSFGAYHADNDPARPTWDDHGACRFPGGFDLPAPGFLAALAILGALAGAKRSRSDRPGKR